MIKDFEGWHTLKKELHERENVPTFFQQEIWWCCIGINIGHEEDGKSRLYSRPILVVRKFNRHIFLSVPLTMQIKQNPFYHGIVFKDKQQSVMLSQVRAWGSSRMIEKMGKLSDRQFEEVR